MNLPKPVERCVGRQVEHVVVELETLDVVKVVEDVLGNALQSVGAEVERVQALLQAAESLSRKSFDMIHIRKVNTQVQSDTLNRSTILSSKN